jgi:hypothetical protein
MDTRMTDRDSETCFVCRAAGDCDHREEGLRGYRTEAAFLRRVGYLARAGRAEAESAVETIAEPGEVITEPQPPVRTLTRPAAREKAFKDRMDDAGIQYSGLRGW